MDRRSSFLGTLDKAERLQKRLADEALAVRWFYEAGNAEEAYRMALRMEDTSERLTLAARALPAYTGNGLAQEDRLQVMKECIPVEIGFMPEGWFGLKIPALLPKKEAGSADYIRSFLYPAMQDYFSDRDPVRFKDCVLVYRHVYDRARPERKKRDHDNIEVNMVSDIIAMYVMPDDGPEVCSHYYCSASGSGERTEVYVVPEADFPQWLAMERTMPDKGVELHEKQEI